MVQTIAKTSYGCPLAGALASRLRASKHDLVLHWLERISQRVSIERDHMFPSTDLLDHVPLLIDGIADYLENPADEISIDMPVVGKAMELGALRHKQGFDAYQILKEYEILGGILFNFLALSADQLNEPYSKSELLVCGHRLFRAISIIQQTTTMHYLRLGDEKVAEREERLRAFNRAISHEIRNHVGAILGAADLLDTIDTMSATEKGQFQHIIVRRAREMKSTLENLLVLARMDGDPRHNRNVRLPEAANEAARQVREAARAAKIRIQVSPELPNVEVNAAAVELCLTNYLSNAIKYADADRDDSFVEITGVLDRERGLLLTRVRDNGLGVPVEKRDKLFQRFFRAHETVTAAEGTGLGLSIVRETVESMGGRAWAEFAERGSTFMFSLPFRRGDGDRRQVLPEPELVSARGRSG
jgi:signal transduction histidine kinase